MYIQHILRFIFQILCLLKVIKMRKRTLKEIVAGITQTGVVIDIGEKRGLEKRLLVDTGEGRLKRTSTHSARVYFPEATIYDGNNTKTEEAELYLWSTTKTYRLKVGRIEVEGPLRDLKPEKSEGDIYRPKAY